MEFLTGVLQKETMEISDLVRPGLEGSEVKVNGAIHTIRDMGPIAFVILRKREGLLQCVYEPGAADFSLKDLKEADTIEVSGTLALSEKAPSGIEVRMKSVRILSEPTEAMPIPVSKWKMNVSLETNLDLRPISLRNIRERAKFRIQEGIVRGFRDFLTAQGFTEIHTPKIGAASAEGGSNVFKLDYFGKKAFLAQSPQFYKQMLVGVYERVYEVGPVFRAEKHSTARHLNEYVSMDFEMGYIHGFEEIMDMEAAMLSYTFRLLEKEYANELKALGVALPKADRIPTVKFREAKEMIAAEYGRKIKDPFDLEPEEEQLIGQYFKEKYDSDFVFITHYPAKKRPFYAMDDPEDPKYTLSFDLLFRGLEITTGGQRIHDYQTLLKKIEARGMTTEGMDQYLATFIS